MGGVKSKVKILLFLVQPNPRTQMRKLDVFLLPWNIYLNEVSAQQRYSENIQVPSECKLSEGQSYTLHCPQAIAIQPESAHFDLEFGPNYFPTFEVSLEATTEEVTLMVKDQRDMVVWKRVVDLTDSNRRTPRMNVPTEDDVPADEKLNSIREEFVKQLSEPVLNQLLDQLYPDVITYEEMQSVKTKLVTQEKARELIDTVRKRGPKASLIMIAALCKVDPHLSSKLHFSSGPSNVILHHQIQAGPSTSETNMDVSEDIREKSEDEENQSCPDDPERSIQQHQLLHGDILNTNDKQNFKAELLNESGKTSYRFRCPGPGVFHCKWTGLVFVMVQEAELLYTTVQWDESLLRSAGKMAAGLLYDITCSKDSAVCQLHLPHCEVMDAPLPEGLLSVFHITEDGINFLEPLEITDTHVVVTVSHFSAFGIVKDCIKWLRDKMRGVKSKVLFLEQPNPESQNQKLSVFLLPRNIHRDESADFDLEFGKDYDPTFEVRLPRTTEEVTLTVRDQRKMVGEHDVDLTDSRRRTEQMNVPTEDLVPTEDDVPADKKLLSIRSQFVKRVTEPVLNQLLDQLYPDVISYEEMQSIRKQSVPQDKARDLIDAVEKRGPKASSVLIDALCELDQYLSSQLKLS